MSVQPDTGSKSWCVAHSPERTCASDRSLFFSPERREFHSGSSGPFDSPVRSEVPSPDRWLSILSIFASDPGLQATALANHNMLLITLKQFRCLKGVPPKFRELVETFGTQDCLKALSRDFDLTDVRRNKYKFMFKKLPLGKATRLLIKEALLFHQNIIKKRKIVRFEEVMGYWVDALLDIHDVPLLVRAALKNAILESIDLSVQLRGNPRPFAETC